MTIISENDVQLCLEKWKNSSIPNRDQLVYEIVFGEPVSFCIENTPIFSGNIVNAEDTNRLVTKLAELGFTFAVDYLPRSSLTVVSYKPSNIKLPPMPLHKAICVMVCVLENEIKNTNHG